MIRSRSGFRPANSGRAAASTVCAFVSTVVALSASVPAFAQEGLEEIVVTAQRRETSLQTTPVAITAYTGEALADAHHLLEKRAFR